MTFADVVASLHSPRPGCIACIARIARNDRNDCNDPEYSELRTRHSSTALRDIFLSFLNMVPTRGHSRWDLLNMPCIGWTRTRPILIMAVIFYLECGPWEGVTGAVVRFG